MADQPQISADYRKYVSFSFPNTDPYYSTIQAAINSISDASPTKPYGVYIYPGKYQETITLKSYVSLIGAGIDDVMIKGGGSSPVIIGPASDSGSGQCFITNLTIDGNGKSAIVFNDTSISTPKTDFIINVKIMTTNPTTTQPGITVEDYQLLDCIELSCIGFPVLPPPPGENPTSIYFPEGIRVTKHGNLRMWQSTVVSESYCLDHSSSEYSETYNCILSSGGPSMQITSGTVNIYNCQTVGGIYASNGGTQVKHVNSFHDGHLSAEGGATIWVSGMKWGQESGIDVIFYLSGGSKIIVSNSKAGVTSAWSQNYVVYVGTGCTFKAFSSEFTNSVSNGNSITGDAGVTVYLYYCTLSKDVTGITASTDSKYVYNVSSD